MFKKMSLLSVALVNLVNFPVLAETTVIQSSSQEANVSGSNNQVIQTTNQIIINHPGRGLQNRYQNKPNNGNTQLNSPRNDDDDNKNRSHQRRQNDDDD